MNPQERKKLENKVLNKLKDQIKRNSMIIAGISGGPDSIFLLHLLKKFEESTPSTIIAAHLNHSIRGKEADRDEKFVDKEATKLAIKCHTLKLDIPCISKKSKKSLEETGRNERYKFFKKLAKKYQANFIITAHHADDNTETTILNLTRGSSLLGLAGMKEIETITEDTELFRPLLDIPKSQILDYLKTNKIPFYNEKTNLDTKYTRNFIRHEIIPKLKTINPSINNTLAKNSQNLREIHAFLEQTAKNWITRNTLNKNHTRFNAKTFRKKPKALQKTIIRQIYKKHIGNTQNLESTHVIEALSIIDKNIGNKKKRLGKLIISIKNNIIHLEKS